MAIFSKTRSVAAFLAAVASSGLSAMIAAQEQDLVAGGAGQAASGAATHRAGVPTLGGMQFWTDELLFHEWRIQRHALTGHHRLLDGTNHRHAWGSFEQCRQALEKIKRASNLPPMDGRAVLVLHGLADPRRSMTRMARYLEKTGRYAVFNLAYASTQGSVGEHAAALARVIDHLEGVDEINFVAHSLGSLIIRHYFGDRSDPQSECPPDPPDSRIRRLVMLGPPNTGAQLAERLGRNRLFHLFAGDSGRQLASGWAELEPNLAIPSCEFAIVAGGRGTSNGRNPLIEGDDDLIVRVEETRLPGARDFIVLPVIHTIMMNDAKVMQVTENFLEHGYFLSEEERQPIRAEADACQGCR